MKRPHRSIETFDISLMAVVTKAMGAFLVLMLLLIPYYKSGPIAQKPIDDLAKKVEEVDKNIKDIVDKLATASAEDLRKLLDEARKNLDDARKLIAELKRAVEQLNAQVQRLTDDNEQLKKDKDKLTAEVEQLKKDKASLTATVEQLKKDNQTLNAQVADLNNKIATLNATIADLKNENDRLKADLADLQRQIDPLKEEVAKLRQDNHDLKQQVEPLKAQNQELQEKLAKLAGNLIMGELINLGCDVGIGFGLYPTNATASITLPDNSVSKYLLNSGGVGESSVAGGGSFFLARAVSPGRYAVVVASKSGKGESGWIKSLKSPAADCKAVLSLQWGLTPDQITLNFPPDVYLAKGSYAAEVGELVVSDQQIALVPPSAQSSAWLDDQVQHAQKEP